MLEIEMNCNSRVLVTGANGFVGKALCLELAARRIVFRPAVRLLAQAGPGAVVTGAIGADTDWSAALCNVDVVVHLAGRAHVMRECEESPLSAFRQVNVVGTLNLARQAAASGVRRFVFVSSVKVNGEGGCRPYSEDDLPAPGDAYAVSKWEAECGLREIASRHALDLVVLRPPLVYGPGVSANFFRLMRLLKMGLPLPFGQVNNLRSLVFTQNLVDLVILCLTHPLASNRVFFASDDEDISTPVLLSKMGHALGVPAKLIPVPPRVLEYGLGVVGRSDVYQRLLGSLCVDISAAKRLLGWSPPVSVDEGLRVTAGFFLSTLSQRMRKSDSQC